MKILMVCLGNICRSPMAEGMLRHLAQERGVQLTIDSAGTEDYHVGEAPDRRARAAMKRSGMNIDALRGRKVEPDDFGRFDLVVAMDRANLDDLRQLAPDEASAQKLRAMMDYAPAAALREVPDPYYGVDADFDGVLELLREACTGLLDQIDGRH